MLCLVFMLTPADQLTTVLLVLAINSNIEFSWSASLSINSKPMRLLALSTANSSGISTLLKYKEEKATWGMVAGSFDACRKEKKRKVYASRHVSREALDRLVASQSPITGNVLRVDCG